MKRISLGLAMLILLSFSATAGADEKKLSVDDIMKIVDETLTIAKDQRYTAEVRVIRDGKTIKSMKFEALLKGLVMKRITFTAPGDVKGMAVLTTADGLMYIYMPSYKRVRRVASHVRNQGFMGTDFSPEELAAASLSVGWNARLLTEDSNTWTLELTPRSGNETIYSKMKVAVSKANRGVERIESYDSAGKLARTQVRTNWKRFGPVNIPMLMTVTDHQTGSRSELHFSDCQVNTGISDAEFSTRALMRAE
jgi:outer membrane lipoprotein-sorting protein